MMQRLRKFGGEGGAEAIAIEHELAAWERQGGYQDRENALRYVLASSDRSIVETLCGCKLNARLLAKAVRPSHVNCGRPLCLPI
jgi:hypothetical protein